MHRWKLLLHLFWRLYFLQKGFKAFYLKKPKHEKDRYNLFLSKQRINFIWDKEKCFPFFDENSFFLQSHSIKSQTITLLPVKCFKTLLRFYFFWNACKRKVLSWLYLVAGFTKAALAALVINYGLVQVGFAELGPAHVGKIQFGISQLIQQKIGDAVFAAGADH